MVVNGSIHDYPLISNLIKRYEYCVAVDGGLIHCHSMGITPNLIIGDFDSIPLDLLKQYEKVPVERFSPEKDESDLELALKAINSPEVKEIGIFGALEKRTDHSLGNLYLGCRFADKVIMETESETIYFISDSKEIVCHPGQILSLMPIGIAKGVTTQGLKWQLQNATLDKNFVSLSNISLEKVIKISVKEGDIICCLARR